MRISDWSSDVCSSDLVEAVDLVDHAVDLEGQLGALGHDVVVEGEQFVEAAAQPRRLVQREAPAVEARAHRLDRLAERLRWLFGERAPAIGEEVQRPRCGDLRIELAQRAGGGVARVGEDLVARSEEHTSELQSLMRISYAVFCLK